MVQCRVLPSIRKHGGYLTQKRSMRCQVIHKTNTWLKKGKGQNSVARAASSLYITFAKASKQALRTINIGDCAKALCGYLQIDNKHYQKCVDNGYFELARNVVAVTKRQSKNRVIFFKELVRFILMKFSRNLVK